MQKRAGKWKEATGWASLEGHWLRRKHFTPEVLDQIAERIRQGERDHAGELMVAIEAVSPIHEPDSRLRALEVFGRLRVWDTPLNTGVLLYLALDRHSLHIIADRGIAASDDLWEQVCGRLQESLRQKRYAPGLLAAIDEIEAILRTRSAPLPEGGLAANELPDQPVLL
ncbi:MAG: TPM domain-containing protein [Burkholderiaceae bacterium]